MQTAFDLSYQAQGISRFAAYVADDDPRGQHTDGTPILRLDEIATWDDIAVFVPIHDPTGRRSVFSRIAEAGLPILGAEGSPQLSHPSATFGEGVIVSSTTRIGYAAQLGRGTIAYSDLVAHDVTVGEFSTLAAHSIVLGHVEIGQDVFVGAGAIIKNGTTARPIRIGDGAVVGVGAVVDRDLAAGEVVVSPRAVNIREWESLRSAAKRLRAESS
ncbi:acetyltransferase [Microbacteriaceae bacterium VKM Ac-2855]|nr:acetyltransferase [Microbacteriaceae bacterium VKM Ac-2855]